MKSLAIFGSTGSIGQNSIEVVRKFPDRFKINILTANSSCDELIKQALEFSPQVVVIRDNEKLPLLKENLNSKIEILSGDDGLLKAAAEYDYDIFIGAMVGFSGMIPTIEAIKRGKRIALANKETLVVAGELVTGLLKEHNSELIPIDSEHSALFQCLVGEKIEEVRKIILTASGGPFLKKSKDEFNSVTVEEALNHPNWKMGSKISIDSASMMNKGLEVIEAHWLFGLNKDKIEVVIHPQSIIHSMVEFIDGSVKAQLSTPDMKLPIQYALSYPERLKSNFVETNLPSLHQLTFFEPDMNKFECLNLAFRVMEEGGTAPCILNAANEIAVEKFLKGFIKFSQIPYIILKSLEKIPNKLTPQVETIIDCDRKTREYALSVL